MTFSSLWFRFSTALTSVVLVAQLANSQVTEPRGSEIVAVVNGKQITREDLDDSVFAEIFALQERIYALRRAALENLVTRKILEAEAARRNVTVTTLRKELTEGSVEVAAAEVEQQYAENAETFGNMNPDEAKERLRLDFESSARMQKYRERLGALRDSANIELLLAEPRIPAFDISYSPARGPTSAQITVVEFADFQCPYCRSSQTVIEEILRTYKNEIRLVFKHLPLEIHSEAFLASQAAYCAAQQNAFWPYHDALFAVEDLSPQNLQVLVARLNLNQTQDLYQAKHFGINSTPTFVINGKLIRGAPELKQLKALIEEELKRVKTTNSSARLPMKGVD
jgi:glutaredoxin